MLYSDVSSLILPLSLSLHSFIHVCLYFIDISELREEKRTLSLYSVLCVECVAGAVCAVRDECDLCVLCGSSV